jgi:hypothetical protein
MNKPVGAIDRKELVGRGPGHTGRIFVRDAVATTQL